MTEENDANQDNIEDVASAESSTDTETLEPIIDDSGFISTTEFKPVEKKAIEKVDTDTDISDETEQKTQTDKSKPKPYHLDPDFQRMKVERDEARQKAEAFEQRLSELESGTKKEQTEAKELRNKVNIMAMDDDELSEMQINEPKKFAALLAQQLLWEIEDRDKVIKQQETQKTYKQKVDQTFESFFKDKEDGIEMLKDGRIKAYIDENPGHNAISAYHELAGESIIQKQVEEAIKKERDKINRELKAAGKASTVPTTTASKTYNETPIGKPAKSKAELKAYMVEQAQRRSA